MDSTKPTPEKVLKMYCANYQSLDEQDHDQLMAIPNGRYHDLYTKHMGKGVIEE